MKKLIVALVVSAFATSAFADGHNMLRVDLNGIGLNYAMQTLDKDTAADDQETTTMALTVDYARKVHSNIQVRFLLDYSTAEVERATTVSETTNMEYGIGAIYNFNTDFKKSLYVGLMYSMFTTEEDVAGSENSIDRIRLEVGKRMELGVLKGANLTWSPSIAYHMLTTGDDYEPSYDGGTEIAINLLKFDVLW
jgi:hypothetical protein